MLADALMQAFPGIKIGPGFDGDECVVVQPSDGPARIAHWSRPEPKPDEAAILAAYNPLPAARSSRITTNRAEARRRIEAKYPLWRQQSAVLGVYPPAYTEQMATDIAAVVQAENAATDAINAATTEAEVAAVTVNWPTL